LPIGSCGGKARGDLVAIAARRWLSDDWNAAAAKRNTLGG
jgi:hypothetical protein